MRLRAFAWMAVLVPVFGAAQMPLAGPELPANAGYLGTAEDESWHVEINGLRWVFPEACLMGRIMGGAEEGRILGGSEEGRILGGSEEGRILGGADEGRIMGGAEEGRILGGADEGRILGGAEEGRILGGADEGRIMGGAEEGRILGGADEGRIMGGAEEGRILGGADEGRIMGGAEEGRILGASESAIRCERISTPEHPNAIFVRGVAVGGVRLNPADPYFAAAVPVQEGSLVILR